MTIAEAARVLTEASYGGSKASGWHNDPRTGAPRTAEQNHEMFPVRLMLTVSELSEAMEGHRKGLMDDKLPHRTMAEVELADAAIRIFDMAGAMGYDLGGAITEKLAFNAQRADHKPENRLKAGGAAVKLTPSLREMLERIDRASRDGGSLMQMVITSAGGREPGKLRALLGAELVEMCDKRLSRDVVPGVRITEAGRAALATKS